MHRLLIIAHKEGDSIEDLMNPYWQDLEVEEYCEGEVAESERQHFIDYYSEHTPGYHFCMEQFDELYKAEGEDWNGNRWRKDDDGVWREYSTANPDMKWDWYEVGGRWAGCLQLREGAKPLAPIHFSWGWEEGQKTAVLEAKPEKADTAYLRDIANLDTLVAAAVMVDGEWVDLTDWEFQPVKEYLEGLPDDTVITCIDYHM